jgi:mannose-1-phosphate guanylyltransferase/uncharacterized membrane protein
MSVEKEKVSGIPIETVEKDNSFLLEQYQVLASDRINHNELFWNVPMMFLTAQSFLLVIALGGLSAPPWGRAIGAFISFVFGILSIQIFERNRINEIADSELLLDIERHFILQGYSGTQIHQKASERSYLSGEKVDVHLEKNKFLKFLNKGVSYELWKKGMWLVSFTSLLLFIYNSLYYYNGEFLEFDCFRSFILSIDKTAAVIILVIFALNWLIYLMDFISPIKNQAKGQISEENVKKSQKLIRILQVSLLGVSVAYSYCVSKNYLHVTELPNMWLKLYIICAQILTVYLFRTSKPIKSKSDDSNQKASSLILAGGQNIRLASSRIGIVKFIDVLNKDRKTLLEDALFRNDAIAFEQVIISIDRYSHNIHAVDSIEKKLSPTKELSERKSKGEGKNSMHNNNQLNSGTASKKPEKSTKKKGKHEATENKEYSYSSDIRLVTEPDSKGTATAIFYYLWDWKHKSISQNKLLDSVLIITPTDHVIPDIRAYSNAIQKVCALAEEFNSIYLLGIIPNYPSTQYGYLRVNNTYSSILKVEDFVEKPKYDEAVSLIREGFVLWNSGVFIARHSVLLEAFEKHWKHIEKFPADYSSEPDFQAIYQTITEESSFDRDVLQNVKNLFAARISFDWVDVGDPQRLQAAVNDKLCFMKPAQ